MLVSLNPALLFRCEVWKFYSKRSLCAIMLAIFAFHFFALQFFFPPWQKKHSNSILFGWLASPSFLSHSPFLRLQLQFIYIWNKVVFFLLLRWGKKHTHIHPIYWCFHFFSFRLTVSLAFDPVSIIYKIHFMLHHQNCIRINNGRNRSSE